MPTTVLLAPTRFAELPKALTIGLNVRASYSEAHLTEPVEDLKIQGGSSINVEGIICLSLVGIRLDDLQKLGSSNAPRFRRSCL